MPKLNRRHFAIATGALVGSLAMPSVLRAQQTTMLVNGPAGTAPVFKEHVFPSFEAAHNCTIVYEAAHSLDGLQKLRANREKPISSMVFMDAPALLQADQDGLLEPVDKARVPNMVNLYPSAIHDDGLFLNYKWPRVAIAYNPKITKGIASWTDLWGPDLKQKIFIPTPKITQFPTILAAAAMAETGKPLVEAQYELDAAFKKLAELKPNILEAFSSSAAAVTLIEQGEAILGASFVSTYVHVRTAAGAPLELGSPKEGSFALPNAVALVKGGPNPELAAALMDHVLSADIQKAMMTAFKDTPTNSTVQLEEGIVSGNDLISLDWAFAGKMLEENSKRFDREIAL